MGSNPVERLVARVALAFFNRFVLRHPGAAAAMARNGNVPGLKPWSARASRRRDRRAGNGWSEPQLRPSDRKRVM